MRLLEHGTADGVERGLLAESLARLVLLHEPADQHAWGLRGDALAAAGRRDAAEALGWERLRRFPENPQWTGQLATLLAEGRGRPREAIALLDTGLALFPSHVTLRPHLGRLLADVADDTARARRLLEDQLARFPESRHAYGELAALLADRLGDTRGAEQVLRDELRRWPDDRLGRYYLERLHAGKRLRRRRDLPPAEEVLADPGGDVPLSLAAARRALFRLELDGHTDEARTALRHASDADPGLLYLHYAAERAGAVEPAAWRDTAFGFAFDRAARAGSAAAFHALARQWPNAVERRLIGHAIGLFSEMVNDPAPTVAAEARGGTPARLAALDAVLRGGDASARLMLLRDFAASDLSLQPIAA